MFGPKKGVFSPKYAFLGLYRPAGSFGALLVGWLVVVVRGLYLARHQFTFNNVQILYFCPPLAKTFLW